MNRKRAPQSGLSKWSAMYLEYLEGGHFKYPCDHLRNVFGKMKKSERRVTVVHVYRDVNLVQLLSQG